MNKKIVLLLLLPLFISCLDIKNNNNNSQTPESIQEEVWYVLNEGEFIQTENLKHIANTAYLPWTVQQRISDFSCFKGNIFAAINGYGIAQINFTNNIPFTYDYYKKLFTNKTITGIFPLGDSLLCHYYFNSILNIAEKTNFYKPECNFLKYFINNSGYQIDLLPLGYQDLNPGWEIVSILPADETTYYLEWKYSDTEITKFRYSLFDFTTYKENEIAGQEYKAAYSFKNINSYDMDDNLKYVFNLVVRNTRKENIFFYLKTDYSPYIKRYKYNENDNLSDINYAWIYVNNDSYYVLLWDEKILQIKCSENGYDESKIILPELPENFNYTNFIVNSPDIALAWENIDFINVGSAGILILKNIIM